MIEVYSYRRQNDRPPETEVLLGCYETTWEKAAKSLVAAELKFGGDITNASEFSLEAMTFVGCKIDRTVYEGPPEEMQYLLAIAKLWEEESAKTTASDLVDRVMELSGGLPLLVQLGAGLVKGEHIAAKVAARLEELRTQEVKETGHEASVDSV